MREVDDDLSYWFVFVQTAGGWIRCVEVAGQWDRWRRLWAGRARGVLPDWTRPAAGMRMVQQR
jgi:hypothetical protein